MIKASNNPLPHDPNDQYPNKLDRGGYLGTAKDLDDKINLLAFPDDILKTGIINFVGGIISIAAFDFIWRIDNVEHTNNISFSSVISPATIGFKRIDIFVLTPYNSILKIEGVETDGDLIKRIAPNGTIEVAYIEINGTTILDPISTEVPGSSGIVVVPFTSFKPIHKGFGNTDITINEIGDIFCGWKNDGTVRYSEAKWLGGSLSDSNNFLPIVQTEI